MSDFLSKLIRLSQKHQLPLIVHDAESGQSSVLMSLEEYEAMSSFEGCCPEDQESEEGDEDEIDDLFFQDLEKKQSKFFHEEESTFQKPEEPPVWEEFEFSPLNEVSVKAAHNFHADRANLDWDAQKSEEFRYELNPGSPIFPAFNPQENEEDEEEPIFFEEPV